MPLAPDYNALEALTRAKESPAAYFGPLLDSPDPIVRMGAWCALLDREDMPVARIAELPALAVAPGLRTRAFRYLLNTFEYALAADVAATPSADEGLVRVALMQAELQFDVAARVEALSRLYCLTGDASLLMQITSGVEEAEGAKAALPRAMTALLIHPHDPLIGFAFVNLLSQGDDTGCSNNWRRCGSHGRILRRDWGSRRGRSRRRRSRSWGTIARRSPRTLR